MLCPSTMAALHPSISIHRHLWSLKCVLLHACEGPAPPEGCCWPRISTCPWQKCHGCGFDLWSVDKQDKRSPSAKPLCLITLPLPEEAPPATFKVGVSFPVNLAPKQQIDSQFVTDLHTLSLSLSPSLWLWQTLAIVARTANRRPGWVSALATVGAGGEMEGVIEGWKG